MDGLKQFRWVWIVAVLLLAAACDDLTVTINEGNGNSETGRVVRIIDGDTIDVDINGTVERVRYVGVNTPERDEVCYDEATEANRLMVEGQVVRLVRDSSDRDRYDRLLRYIYVGETFVNRELIVQGYAEVVLYPPDDAHYEEFRSLEEMAAASSRGCHPTGIFNDGSDTR